MRNLILGAATLALAFIASPLVSPASAEVEYPYCSSGPFGASSCTYATLEQCRAAVSAGAGFCSSNPRYAQGAYGNPPTRTRR